MMHSLWAVKCTKFLVEFGQDYLGNYLWINKDNLRTYGKYGIYKRCTILSGSTVCNFRVPCSFIIALSSILENGFTDMWWKVKIMRCIYWFFLRSFHGILILLYIYEQIFKCKFNFSTFYYTRRYYRNQVNLNIINYNFKTNIFISLK